MPPRRPMPLPLRLLHLLPATPGDPTRTAIPVILVAVLATLILQSTSPTLPISWQPCLFHLSHLFLVRPSLRMHLTVLTVPTVMVSTMPRPSVECWPCTTDMDLFLAVLTMDTELAFILSIRWKYPPLLLIPSGPELSSTTFLLNLPRNSSRS